jgi:hypothetical protein
VSFEGRIIARWSRFSVIEAIVNDSFVLSYSLLNVVTLSCSVADPEIGQDPGQSDHKL